MSSQKVLIKNGTIITTENEYVADILCENEKIKAIGKDLVKPEELAKIKVIDATGKYVMPGGIDQHVHYSFVYKGSRVRGFETTNACALGGTTTIVEFVNQERGKGIIQSLDEYNKEYCEKQAMVDYSFHPIMTDPRPEVVEEVSHLGELGYPTIKLFMAYKGQFFHADDSAIIAALEAGKKSGVTVMVHAENADMIDYLTNKLIAEGKTESKYHSVSRPVVVEAEATRRAIYLAEMANAPIYIVHVTCKEALEEIKAAQQKGQSVYGETCSHYLLFDESYLDLPNDEGAKFVLSPALRPKLHQEYLWEALNNGWLNAISSDHCGFDFKVQKHLGIGKGMNFSNIPNGAPGAQGRFTVMWTFGVETGKISKQRFVEVISTNPAKNNGLVNKGHIAVGYDADIVVFDPKYTGKFTVNDFLEGVDYTIYEGLEQKGRVETVLLRGNIVVENAKYCGKQGQGKLIKAKPYGLAWSKFQKK